MWESLALGALGGSLLGGGGGQRLIRRRGRKTLQNLIIPTNRENLAAAQQQFEQAPRTIREGYGQARRAVGESFRGAQRSILEQSQQARGDILQRMNNSGFSGASSIAAGLRSGLGYGTARAIQGVQDRIAEMSAGLATNEARDLASAQQALGSFFLQKRTAEQMPNMLEWELLTQMQPSQQQQLDLSGIAQLVTAVGGLG